MNDEMKMLFAFYYEKCYDYFADLRKGDDLPSLNYDKGMMDESRT